MTKKIHVAAIVLILLYFAILAYNPSFQAPFQLDDFDSIVNNSAIKNLRDIKRIWQWDPSCWAPSRFLPHLTFAINYHLHDLDPTGYHIINFLIHVLVAILVYLIAKETYLLCRLKENFSDSQIQLLALGATLFYLIHPIQTSAVTYTVQRSTLLASGFYLTSLLLYIYSRLKKDSLFYLFSLLSAFMGIFCKPIIVSLALMILFYEIYFLKGENQNPKRIFVQSIRKTVPFFLITMVIPLIFFFWKKISSQCSETVLFSHKEYLLTQINVYRTYLRLVILPINQNLDYDYKIVQSFFSWTTLLSLSFFGCLWVLAKTLFKRHKIISFGILWFFVTLIPESSLFPLNDVLFEHRLYLPLAGIAFLIPILIARLCSRFRTALSVLCVIVLCFSYLTYQRNRTWQDTIVFLNDVIKKSPQKARTYHSLGHAYFMKGQYDLAIQALNKAIALNPDDDKTYHVRGKTYIKKGKYELGLADYAKALDINPLNDDVYNSRAFVYMQSGQMNLALKDVSKAISINPGYPEAYYNRANLYRIMRNDELSMADYNQAILLNPQYTQAYYYRATIYLAHRQYGLALSDTNKAIALDPYYVNAYYHRGKILEMLRDYNRALKDFNTVLALNPNFVGAHAHRAFIFAQKEMYAEALSEYNLMLKANPQSYAVHLEKGKIYYLKKQYTKALNSFNNAIAIDVYNPLGYRFRASAHEALNEAQKAQEDMKQFQSLQIK